MECLKNFFSRRRRSLPRESENPVYPTTEERMIRRGATSSPRDDLSQVVVQEDDLECSICKESMPIGSTVNKLPCSHIYHPSCISSWLNIRRTCPICRRSVLSTPTSSSEFRNRETVNWLNDDDDVRTMFRPYQNMDVDNSSVDEGNSSANREFNYIEMIVERNIRRMAINLNAMNAVEVERARTREMWILLATAAFLIFFR